MARRAAPARLQDFTGYLLRRAFVRASGAARDCLPSDSHVREVAVLAILDEHGAVSQRALGDVTHVNRTLIVRLVDALEEKGWARRERSAVDRRSYALALTPAGRRAWTALRADLARGEADLTQRLTSDEVIELRDLLVRLLGGDEAVSVTTLSGYTGYLVAQAHHKLRRAAEALMEPIGLHPRDFGALSTLAEAEPCSQNALALRMGITPPGALAIVEELEARGLVTRTRNAADRRVYDLGLTERGREALAAARKLAVSQQATVVKLLTRDGDARLRELLAKLIS